MTQWMPHSHTPKFPKLICWIQVFLILELASLDKRVDGLESQKASMELKFVIQKQEYTKQINDFKSLTDTSFKSFMERIN